MTKFPAANPFQAKEFPSDVLALIDDLTAVIGGALSDNLAALYLTGSLTYGDFDPGSSDLDYLAITHSPIGDDARRQLETAHADLFTRYPIWRERVEGSFVTSAMLSSVLPPTQGRPYLNGGQFWTPDPAHGNEWLINLYALQSCGEALIGPPPAELIPPVRIEDVRAANRRDLFEERLPVIAQPDTLPNSHHEAYVTLTLCRILHREFENDVVSKRVAARWTMARYGAPWQSLIERALAWQHGDELNAKPEVIAFTQFVADRLSDES